MKRIGLISDTHSCWDENYREIFSSCDEIWHCGDIGDISIADRLAEIAPLRAVSGNIDYGDVKREFNPYEIFEVEGVKVFMTHIGGYPGKYAKGVKPLLRRENIRLFVDGHSHILKVKYDPELKLLHINPGAAGTQGWQQIRTLVRFSVHEGNISDLEVIELYGRHGSGSKQQSNPIDSK